MYEDLFHFYGLREDPFHVSPDPRYYFATHSHNSTLKELTAGIESRRGLFVLTGEAGTGKTTLVRHFLDWLEARHQSSCYIFHSQLRPMELLEMILQDFGIACSSRDKHDIVVALNKWLVERRRMGDSPVLVIDEAQTSPLRTLRRLNVLLNLELDACKLLQVVLTGQPELEDKLQRPELWQLQQRIILRSRLMPLAMEETGEYVRSRLEKAGTQGEVFCKEALQAVHSGARGIPRVINLLCEHALIAGYSERVKPITATIVRAVAADFDLSVQTGMLSETELKPQGESAAATRTEKTAAAAPAGDAIIAEETVGEAYQNIPQPIPSSGKWPIHLPNVERAGPSQAASAEKLAPVAVVESKAPLATREEIATKMPEAGGVAAGNAATMTVPALGRANVQAAAEVLNATVARGTVSAVSAAVVSPLKAPNAPEGGPVPLAVAAAAMTLSTAPAFVAKAIEIPVPDAPKAAKVTAFTEEPAKSAKTSVIKEAATVARAMPRPVVVKPPAPKPTVARPISKVTPKVAKPKSVPVNWKLPGLVENCLSYCRAVVKSFVADWKQFVQVPIQTRKQSGAGTGND